MANNRYRGIGSYILITFLRNADRVKVACLAQLVNVIAPIMTRKGGGTWAQTIYWPFFHASKYGRGTALRAIVDTPTYDCADYERVPLIDATATMDDEGGVTVFCVNRDPSEDFCLDLNLRAFGNLTLKEHILLHHDDTKAVNTEDNPMNVAPQAGPGGIVDSGDAGADLMDISVWHKLNHPVFTTDAEKGLFGPGHNTFFTDEAGDVYTSYHARPYDEIIGDPLYDPNRHCFIMRVSFENGLPVFSSDNQLFQQ